jgi:hypothetical protein
MVSLVLNSSVADCKRDAAASRWLIVIPDTAAKRKKTSFSAYTQGNWREEHAKMKRGRCKISAAVLERSKSYSELEQSNIHPLNSSQKTAARTKPCKSKRDKINGSAGLHLLF